VKTKSYIEESFYIWLAIDGVEEIRIRMTAKNETDVLLSFVLRVRADRDLDEVLDEATEHMTDEHKKYMFVTTTYGNAHFDLNGDLR
jgi:hypothetical protein